MDTEIIREEVNSTNMLSEEALNSLGEQSGKLPGHDDFCASQKNGVHKRFKKAQKATPGRVNNLWQYDEKFFFPPEKALGFREFLSSILQSVFRIPGHFLCALLASISSMIKYRAQVFTTEFVSKSGTQSPLRMGEAFTMFFPQITDIMTIMLCYVLMLWLVCPLHPVFQMFFLLMLIAIPCYHIPEMMGMASRIDVTCGFFKLPLIWFTVSGGLVLSLISASLSLLVMYLIKRFIHPGPGGPTVKQFEVSSDASSDVAIHPGPWGPTVKQFEVSSDAFSDVVDRFQVSSDASSNVADMV